MVSSCSKSANRPFLFASSVSVPASRLGPLGKSLVRSESQGGMGQGRGIRSGVGDGLARGRPVIDFGLWAQEGAWGTQEFAGLRPAPGWSRPVAGAPVGCTQAGAKGRLCQGTFGEAQAHVWGGVLACVQGMAFSKLQVLVCGGRGEGEREFPFSFLLLHLPVLLPSFPFSQTCLPSMCHTSNKIQNHCSQ